jgi:hypothetical protein
MRQEVSMRQLALLICTLMTAPVLAADSHDLSFWTKRDGDNSKVFPWYTFTNGRVAFDIRYNVDARHAQGVFVGAVFVYRGVTITPHVGGIFGNDAGPSVQLNLATKHGKLGFYSLNQFAQLARIRNTSDYTMLYHFGDFSVRPHRRFSMNVGEQVYRESGQPASVDVGPAVTVYPGRGLYAKLWITTSPTHDWNSKTYIGIGYAP